MTLDDRSDRLRAALESEEMDTEEEEEEEEQVVPGWMWQQPLLPQCATWTISVYLQHVGNQTRRWLQLHC